VDEIISLPSRDVDGFAAELWAERGDDRPWQAARATDRQAYSVFAAFTLAALRESDSYAGSC
jgi:hypothetical protein